jgi:Ni/Fe-hydrogenase subunit HybB-like protein
MGTAIVLFYTVTGSIIAYDFIMSMSPEWISTMFAPYYWVTNAYAGMSALVIMATLLREPLGIERYTEAQQFHDMGNLMLGFSLFSMGLFFAQYLTIWYENLPQETGFLILRYDKGAWPPIGWLAFFLAYAIPFVLLQSRQLKRNRKWLSAVSVMVLVGVALDRYVLVTPSIEPHKLMLYPAGMAVLLAYLGAFILAVVTFLSRYSPVSAADLQLESPDMTMEAVS